MKGRRLQIGFSAALKKARGSKSRSLHTAVGNGMIARCRKSVGVGHRDHYTKRAGKRLVK